MNIHNRAKIRDTFIIDGASYADSDITVENGNIVFAGWGRKIPISELNREAAHPYQRIPYSAGTAKVMGIDITGTPVANKHYNFIIRLWQKKAAEGIIINPNELYNRTLTITILSADTSTTTLATALLTEINRRHTDGTLPILASNQVTSEIDLTADNALFNFQIESPEIAATVEEDTAWVEPSGSYEEVVKINPNAVSGKTYDYNIFRSMIDAPGHVHGNTGKIEVEDIVFIDLSATNYTAINSEIAEIAGMSDDSENALAFSS